MRYTPTNAVESVLFLDKLSNVIADSIVSDILILGGDFNHIQLVIWSGTI